VPQPSFKRVASILWFPFFLAVAMSLLFVAPLAHPAPHNMRIGVVGTGASELQSTLDKAQPGGFIVESLSSTNAESAVRENHVAAAITTGTKPQVLVASSAGATRVSFLEGFLPSVVDAEFDDIAPSAIGDKTGTGVFFYTLPIGVVAMVSAIVLLQLGAWSYRRRLAAVTVVAAFTSIVTFAVAAAHQVIPVTGSSALLMLGTFALVQAIGWTLTGAAEFVKQFPVPIALTFVLVLGVPTAGAPVTPDMLPAVLGAVNQVMPLGQFVSLVRSLAYGVGSPLHPTIVLLAWLAVGALLIYLAERRRGAIHVVTRAAPKGSSTATSIHGTVTTLSGAPVPHATLWLLNGGNETMVRTETTSAGDYVVSGISEGEHHIVITAEDAEPEIVTLTVHGHPDRRHDFALQLWTDPAANLADDTVGERTAPR
jgi:ABC-type multidrug transport system permease subunit